MNKSNFDGGDFGDFNAFDHIDWDALDKPDDGNLRTIEDPQVQNSDFFQRLMNSDSDFELKDGYLIGDFNLLKDEALKLESENQAAKTKRTHLTECTSCVFEGFKAFNFRFTTEYRDEKTKDLKRELLFYLSSLGYDTEHILQDPLSYGFNDKMNIVFDYKMEISFEQNLISYEVKTNNPDLLL